MHYFSLFSGIGGFEYGIAKYAKCVGCSEIDRYARAIYKFHYPEHKNYGDARTINTSELPDFDLLVAGFPCQSFSIAGKRQGFMDTRGTLFFEIKRILSDKRPRYFLLENVKGLLSHDDRKTFVTIIRVLSDVGYRIQWQVLNSKDYGLAQNRERIFIIGNLREIPRPEIFPISEESKNDNRIVGKEIGMCLVRELTKNQAQGMRVYSSEGLSVQITSESGGWGPKTGLYAVPIKYLNRNQKNYKGDYSFVIDRVNTGGILKDSKIRKLTPVECERLQGFPDNWTQYGIIEGEKVGVSDTQRYKCLGNAVSTSVITRIMQKWQL